LNNALVHPKALFSQKIFFQFCRELLQAEVFFGRRKISERETGEFLAYFSAT